MRLYPYTAASCQIFYREKRRLRRWLGPCAIEHFGSTSLGIPGKGIIDIIIGFPSETARRKAIAILIQKGYCKDDHVRTHRIFMSSAAGESKPDDIHLHLVLKNSLIFNDAILFRDYLRNNPTELKKYLKSKREIARTSSCRKTYTRRKSKIVEKILEKAEND